MSGPYLGSNINGFGGPIGNPNGNTQISPPSGGRQSQPVETHVSVQGDTEAAQANAAITNANAQLARHADNVRRNEHLYSAEGVKAELDEFASSPAVRTVDEYVKSHDAHVAELAANVDNVRRSLSPEGDTAAELRATRAWDRHRRTLDTQDSGKVPSVVMRTIETAPPAERAVLLQELPGYLESRGMPTEIVDATAERVIPELAAAKAELRAAEREQQIINRNAGAFRTGVKNGRPATVIVPLRK
jgi:hypothetical protein